MSKTIQKNCEFCGATFHPQLSDVKRGGGRFCSLSCSNKSRKSKYNRQINESHRDWVANATDEQKELWILERRLHNDYLQKKAYMAVVDRLIELTPIDKRSVVGGSHYGRPIKSEREGDLEGMKVNLKRF